MNHRLHALLPNLEGPCNTREALFFARDQVLHLGSAVMAPCGALGLFQRGPATMRR